jgi:hypothetical protein
LLSTPLPTYIYIYIYQKIVDLYNDVVSGFNLKTMSILDLISKIGLSPFKKAHNNFLFFIFLKKTHII